MRDSALMRRVAMVVSLLGHPLLTSTAFVAFVGQRQLRGVASAWGIGCVVLLVVVPISLWNIRQTQRGAYTNFDVSQQAQRQSFYPVLLGLLGLAVCLLFWQHQASEQFRYGLLAAWLLLLVCYGLNCWLKVSLHAAISFFLACVLLYMEPVGGMVALGLAAGVAASRLVLRRHTLGELVVGSMAGMIGGGALAWVLHQA